MNSMKQIIMIIAFIAANLSLTCFSMDRRLHLSSNHDYEGRIVKTYYKAASKKWNHGIKLTDPYKLAPAPLANDQKQKLKEIEQDHAFMAALSNARSNEIQQMLINGTDPNKFIASDTSTPLLYAITGSNEMVLKLLLEHNADPNKSIINKIDYGPLSHLVMKLSNKNRLFFRLKMKKIFI